MAFPSSLDSFPDAATLAGETLATYPHSALHGSLGVAVAALEAKVGVDSSAVTSSLDYLVSTLTTTVAGLTTTVAGYGNIVTHNAADFDAAGVAAALVDDLSGVSNAATARTNLGLGSIATQASNNVTITGGSVTGITDVAVADGGTAASTTSAAKTNLKIGYSNRRYAHFTYK